MKKVVQQFASLSDSYQTIVDVMSGELPAVIAQGEPRISRGEQYKELPWVMLDYPRVFGKEEIFAVRTMFWWGHDYSITLHLRGNFLRTFKAALEAAIKQGKLKGFLLSGVADEWMHHHEAGSHVETEGLDAQRLKALLDQKPFLKLRRGFPLADWPATEKNLRSAFQALIQVFLAVSSQGGERVP